MKSGVLGRAGGANKSFGNFNAAAWASAVSSYKGVNWGALDGNLWAPDVIWNPTMNKWCMYLSLNGVEFNSCIILLTADNIEGPYYYQGPVVFSGFNVAGLAALDYKKTDLELAIGTQASLPDRYVSSISAAGTCTWGNYWPHCIDPCVFYDEKGKLWMTYGSWSNGIWMLELDEETGLRDYNVAESYGSDAHRGVNVSKDPYFGTKIAGGRGHSGEASYIKHLGDYYYLFVTYGGLVANGGYQMRVFRSANPNGPYVDTKGTSAILTTDTRNGANYGAADNLVVVGENMFGAYGNWGFTATGNSAERSQGHNSFITREDRSYLVYHTRFQNLGEGHEVRVHQVFQNQDGWLCAAPFEFTGETVTNTQIKNTQQVASASIPGSYKLVVHKMKMDHAAKELALPVKVELKSDGTITGDKTGTWSIVSGTSYINMTIDGTSYKGVMVNQKLEPTDNVVPAFTAVTNSDGHSVWGYKAETEVIGTTSTGWTTAYTTPVKLAANKMVTYSFTVNALGTGTYDGPVIDLSKTNTPNANNEDAHLFLRMADWAFRIGTKDWWTGAITHGNTLGTTATKDVIVGASVVVTVRRTGTKAIVQTDITKSGTTYHHYYAQDLGTTDDIYVMLAGDNTQFTLTDTSIDSYQVNGTLIGNEVNNTGFTVDATKYKLVPNGTLKLHFTNYTNKLILYNNWGVEMVTGGKYFNLVAGGNIWGELNVAGTAENVDWPTGAVLSDKLDGADVQLTIVRDEGKVTVKAVHTTKDGETFTRGYSFTPDIANFASTPIDVSLSTEGAHLDLLDVSVGTKISDYDWSTFVCGDYALDFSNVDGLTAYAVTGHDGSNVNKVEVANAVPANTPLLLNGDANTTYFIPIAATSGTAPSGNLLKAGTGATVSPEDGKTKYALSVEAGAAHFKKIEAARAIPVGKAYLQFNEEVASRSLGFDGDGTTGINMVNGEGLKVNGSEVYYDLQGRRVLYPKKGLYIVNGKKVIINK